MEEELQQLRELVAQLKADNEKLHQERTVEFPGPSAAFSAPVMPVGAPVPLGTGATQPERFVFVPRDRRCPKFNGHMGISIEEWIEEVQACMQLRHLSVADRAFFLFDHLEGEAREEIRHRSAVEKGDPDKILSALREVFGCSQSYVALQEAFFSRKQREGETLLEFSLALMSLLEGVKQQSPYIMSNSENLLRDQFVEHVVDSSLRRELKQLVRRQPTSSLLEVRREAIRWEREGMPGGARGRSQSVPLVPLIQYGVQGRPSSTTTSLMPNSELSELREMLKSQQVQLDQLTKGLALLQGPAPAARSQSPHSVGYSSYQRNKFPNTNPVICRRCQQPGHFARECDGERIPSRSKSPFMAPRAGGSGQPHLQRPSEN